MLQPHDLLDNSSGPFLEGHPDGVGELTDSHVSRLDLIDLFEEVTYPHLKLLLRIGEGPYLAEHHRHFDEVQCRNHDAEVDMVGRLLELLPLDEPLPVLLELVPLEGQLGEVIVVLEGRARLHKENEDL